MSIIRSARDIAAKKETEYLTARPASIIDDFPLRKKQEDELYKALQQPGRHILLYGAGGMGKTHMARKLFYRLVEDYSRMAWVEYGEDIRTALTPPPTDGINESEDARFDRFIQNIEEYPEETIVFIDDAKENAMDDNILAQITGMGITILMTSRCPQISPYETWELEQVSTWECAELFYANYKYDSERTQEQTVLKLADQLNRNVFAMRLLASVAGEPENLPRISTKMIRGTVMDHIEQILKHSQLTRTESQILHCLSLMPSGEVLESLVSWFDFQPSDVNLLVEKGWLFRNSETNSVNLHDLVREYYAKQELDDETAEVFIKAALGEKLMAKAKPQSPAEFKGKALDFQVKALELLEHARVRDAQALLVAYNNIGAGLDSFGDYRRSLTFHLKALEICKEELPTKALPLATTYNNLGTVYGHLGEYHKALEYHLKDLEICEKVLLPNDPNLAISYNNVGSTYKAIGNLSKALEYHLKDLEISESTLSSDDPSLAKTYNNMGTIYGDLGDHAKEQEYLTKALTIYEKALPHNHPSLATTYNNLGISYYNIGEMNTALEYLGKAVEIREKVLPYNHPLLASSYSSIGAIYDNLEDYQEALKYQLKALEILVTVLPLDHPEVAVSYNNVGSVYNELGEYSKALKYYEKALLIYERTLPADHPDIASFYNNIGYTFGDLGEHDKELEYYKRALAILEAVLPENHPDIANICYNIACTYAETSEHETALVWMRRVLNIVEKTQKDDSSQIMEIKVAINDIEKQIRNGAHGNEQP